LDQALLGLRRQHVRGLDDVAIGVEGREDAEEMVRVVARAISPLELNKSKTRLRKVDLAVTPDEDASKAARRLLDQADSSPDRVQLAMALGRLRGESATWDVRRRQRWIGCLVDAAGRLRVCVPQILRFIEKLMPGTEGPAWNKVSDLLSSPEPLLRAEAARFLSRHLQEVRARLTWLATTDEVALVRREALFGLVRLDAKTEVKAVLRGTPQTVLDRSAWLVASAVLNEALPFKLETQCQRLLYRAAREHHPGEV
jgi:hypothetical protein